MQDTLRVALFCLDENIKAVISPMLIELGHDPVEVGSINADMEADVILFASSEQTLDAFTLHYDCAVWLAIEIEFIEPSFSALLELGIHDVLIMDELTRKGLAQSLLRAAHRREIISGLDNHDSLTGSLSAEGFVAHLDHAADAVIENGRPFSVISLDIAKFQNINETHGYAIANQLLCMVAQRLGLILGGRFSVGRLGGNEFLLLIEDISDKTELSQMLDIVRSAFNHHFELFGQRIYLETFIGAVLYPETVGNSEELIAQAHEAMMTGKRNNQQIYLYDRSSTPWFQMDMTAEIRRALREDEFQLYYQPRIELSTGRVKGMEALMRWKHPIYGNIPPTDFIYVAENSGLILPLGNWVLDRAEKDIKTLESQGMIGLSIAINLSFKQLQDPTFCESLRHRIKHWQNGQSQLEFELTETAVLSNPGLVKATLTAISEMGVKISLDDFGTGYSALVHVKEFPISVVKIDKSFVQRMEKDRSAHDIVESIINFAHRLNLEVVGEGIELIEHLTALKEMGCEEGQGYYFAKALPLDEFVEYVAKSNQVSLKQG